MTHKKIKGIKDNNKVDIHGSEKEPYCNQWKEDILFEFGCITSNKGYSFAKLKEVDQTDRKAISNLLGLIIIISSSTWLDLSTRSKEQQGGFECLSIGDLNYVIHEKYNINMSQDKKIHVFRFGNRSKYRMIGYKSHNCSRVLHILGFDLDFTLYDHGS